MESWLSAGLIAVGVVILVVVFVAMAHNGKPLRRLFGSCIQGISAIIAVNVAGAFTGVSLGFSWFSAAICVLLGLPGVVTMLLLKAMMGIN